MILRKPYAFLIKYFKIIHIVMFFLFAYLVFLIRPIYIFFLESISGNNYMYFENIANRYVPPIVFIVVLVIMVLAIAIFFLMRKKEKPVLFYKLTIVYTFVLLVTLIYFYFFFKSLNNTNYAPLRIVVNRDIIMILYYLNFIFVGFSFIRAFGFDIKKFSFDKDRKELQMDAADREEYEVNINVEKEDILNYVNKQKREFKYYFMENSRFFIIVGSILILSLTLYFGYSHFVINKVYREKNNVTIGNITYTVNKSFVTNIDKYGKKMDNNFLIVYLNIKNNGNKTTLNDQQFRLNINNNYYYPATSSCDYFNDLGICYNDPEIASNSNKEYIIAYKLESKISKPYFEILKNKKNYQYSKVALSYKTSQKEIINYEINNTFNINDISIEVRNYSILNKTSYVYEECNNNSCNKYTKVVIPKLGDRVLKLTISNLDKLSDDFVKNYFGLKYRNNILYGSDIEILSRYNNDIYLGIPSMVHDEDRLSLVINTRDREYDVLLKEGKNE